MKDKTHYFKSHFFFLFRWEFNSSDIIQNTCFHNLDKPELSQVKRDDLKGTTHTVDLAQLSHVAEVDKNDTSTSP